MKKTILITILSGSLFASSNYEKIDMHGGKADPLINKKKSFTNLKNSFLLQQPKEKQKKKTLNKQSKKEN